MQRDQHMTGPSWAGTAGAVLAALSIGLSAWAAHGLDPGPARAGVQTASLYAFGHGVALAALARAAVRRLGVIALAVLLLGTVLFCGSVAGGALLGWPTRLAPAGGSLMMLGWLLWAADALRR
ncbi:DUF423 domain-containing protein [Pseudoxanthomonas koreensis]|uniref:DUF423 domain-containing protein n=1 Tax=Pseudoxanthomonas koreensis TaxID=266061 RepID=UPI0035A73047